MEYHFSYDFSISLSSRLLDEILKIEVEEWDGGKILLSNPDISYWRYKFVWEDGNRQQEQLSEIPTLNFTSYVDLNRIELLLIDGDSNSLICEIELRRCL